MKYNLKTNNSAFTLVELSIVLVILGLLTGGILAGKSLIRASELRSVMTEYTNYKTAIFTFKDKYFALPGDMTNATAFWGAAHATPATCVATVGSGTETCNGDGDLTIILGGEDASERGEGYMFWQHLGNAGLIEGRYTGMAGPSSDDDDLIGENVPASKLDGGAWNIENYGVWGGGFLDFAGDYGNHNFEFGAKDTVYDEDTDAPLLTPTEAYGIDSKIDDGKPGLGKVIVKHWDECTNAGGDTDVTADYDGTIDSIECSLHFLIE